MFFPLPHKTHQGGFDPCPGKKCISQCGEFGREFRTTLGALLRGRTATQRSKKGSEKGSGEGFSEGF